jgi:peptidoglycan-associated lipoprotein
LSCTENLSVDIEKSVWYFPAAFVTSSRQFSRVRDFAAAHQEEHMKKRIFALSFVVTVFFALVLAGCPKKTEVSSSPGQQTAPVVKEEAKNEPKIEPVKEPETAAASRDESKERSAAANAGLQPVYFDFDRALLRADAVAVMKANAEWLKANPQAKIRIEGNCDDRGAREYNQALGQRRAAAAKKYLTDLGIAGKRISLISYGKEKQVCQASTEECWQKNRRDDFVAAGK